MARSAGAWAQLPLFNVNITLFFKASKVNFHFISWHIFHAKTSHHSCAVLNISQTKTSERLFQHKLSGEESEVLFQSPQRPRDALSAVFLDYQCSGVTGLAGQDKTDPDEADHGGEVRAALGWWGKAARSEVGMERCRIDPSDPAHCWTPAQQTTDIRTSNRAAFRLLSKWICAKHRKSMSFAGRIILLATAVWNPTFLTCYTRYALFSCPVWRLRLCWKRWHQASLCNQNLAAAARIMPDFSCGQRLFVSYQTIWVFFKQSYRIKHTNITINTRCYLLQQSRAQADSSLKAFLSWLNSIIDWQNDRRPPLRRARTRRPRVAAKDGKYLHLCSPGRWHFKYSDRVWQKLESDNSSGSFQYSTAFDWAADTKLFTSFRSDTRAVSLSSGRSIYITSTQRITPLIWNDIQ